MCVWDVLGLTCLVGLIRNTGDIYMSIMCLGLHGLCGDYTYMVHTDYMGYTYMVYTDYTDYVGGTRIWFTRITRITRIMWGVHVSGLPEESKRGICDEIRHLGQFLIIPSLPLFARNRFWPS